MKVRFVQSVSTAQDSFGFGQTHDLPDLLASQWVAAGYCVALEAPKPSKAEPVETPAEPTPEPPKRRTRKSAKAEHEPDLM